MIPCWNPKTNEMFIYNVVNSLGQLTKTGTCYYKFSNLVDVNGEKIPDATPYWNTYNKAFAFYDSPTTSYYYLYPIAIVDDVISLKDQFNDFKVKTETLLNTLDTKVSMMPISELEVTNILESYEKRMELKFASAISQCNELYSSLKKKERELKDREHEIDKLQVSLNTQISCIPNLR